MRGVRGGGLSRVFASVALGLTSLVWAAVAGPWGYDRVERGGITPSQELIDGYRAHYCRPPTSREAVYWGTTAPSSLALARELQDSDEGIRVRAIRRVYLDVLMRDPFDGDCAGLREWVERPVSVSDIARRFASSPEARRVAEVRRVLAEVNGRDPLGWENATVRRWVQSGLSPLDIRRRVQVQRPLVGVYYFTWYLGGVERWGNGTSLVPDDTQKPELGYYDSSDVNIIDRHIEQMEASGFDFVIVQMVANAPHIWETAHRFFGRLAGRRLKAVVMIDGLYDTRASAATQWVTRAESEFSGYPNYMFLRGQPLVLLYSGRLDFPVPGVQVRNVYWARTYGQGEDEFNPGGLLYPHDWPFWSPTPQPVVNGVVPVLPGYSDAHLGREESMEYARNSGRMYHEQWQRALTLRPEFILVYSWNEHFERTAIEPTSAWGDQYLTWTACYVAHAHAGREGAC